MASAVVKYVSVSFEVFGRVQGIFWSLDQLVVETLGVASVRTSVCPYATVFSETIHYFFLKLHSYLGLVVERKMFQAIFFDNFYHFGQKLVKIGPDRKFPKIPEKPESRGFILSKFHLYFGKQPVHILKAWDQ